MSDQGEQGPLLPADGDEREWAHWWQGYWSDAPEHHEALDGGEMRHGWRESAHEFDFGGGDE
jgi:hypothetical protein